MRYIYLHGFASSPLSRKAAYFREQFAARGVTLEVPALDEGDFERLTITGQLAVIERAAAGGPVSLIGSSMGGYLAALYASGHPEADRLVLMAPAFAFLRRWPSTFGEDRVAQWRRTGRLEVYHYGDKTQRHIGYQLIEDGAKYPDFPDFKQPALIFHGEADSVVLPECSRQFAAEHSNVTLRIVASDHELHDVLPVMCAQSLEFFGL
jgi:pimeloyl-ACP methyl ester carboxylesterase